MLVMEELLTPEEVAKLLNVSEFTVKRLLRRGELHGLKISRQWRVRPSDVKDYLDKQGQNKK